MTARTKLYIAGAVLLLALGMLLRPAAQRPADTVSSAARARRARPARPAPTHPSPSRAPRRAKDFQSFAQLALKGGFPKLSPEEIDHHLQTQNRSADSLLSAFRLSGDEAYLTEALAKFPNNPQVLFSALRLSSDPTKCLALLESFKRADPGNGIGNCLAAKTLFDLGRNDEALAELLQSSGKPIDDFTISSWQNDEEAYLSAGFSPVEAKMTSLYNFAKPAIIGMRQMTKKLDEVRSNHAAAGDDVMVQSMRDIQLEMGSHLQEDPTVVGVLVGLVIEKAALKGSDAPEAFARIEEIELQKKSMNDDARKVTAMIETSAVPENDWLLYFDRVKLFGEKAANDWLLGKHPKL